ncbi:unnamed protein product [Discosporangium mesarthrocarpum]
MIKSMSLGIIPRSTESSTPPQAPETISAYFQQIEEGDEEEEGNEGGIFF